MMFDIWYKIMEKGAAAIWNRKKNNDNRED